MTITREHPCLHLSVLPGVYYVRKVDQVPADVLRKLADEPQTLLTITRTAEEISIAGQCTPEDEAEGEWRCIKIAGPMPFGEHTFHHRAHTGLLSGGDRPHGHLNRVKMRIFASRISQRARGGWKSQTAPPPEIIPAARAP